MANIAIIRLLYGMTIAPAQLAGEILAAGHNPLIIFFKRMEMLPPEHEHDPGLVSSDIPMTTYIVNQQGVQDIRMSLRKTTKAHELRHLVTRLKEFQPDVIGISCLSDAMSLASEVTSHLRLHFDAPIIWGGTGPTLEAERAIADADLVCVGEGEEVLHDIGARLDNKQSLEGIAGTWFRQRDGSVQKNPKRPVSDLDTIAVPQWDPRYYTYIAGLKFERHFIPNQELGDKSYQIMTQRGCPFSCSFCVESWYQDEFGKKGSLRRMSPDKALRELKFAKEQLGYKTVTFMDDVFTVNPRWLKEFLPRYKKEIGLPFFCYTYPTTHNREILAMLNDAGCHAIAMGVQSGSQRLLTEFFNRPTHYERIIEAAREIAESGIPAASFDMIPRTVFDREEDLRETFELLLQIPKMLDSSFYAQMAYFPGYDLTQKAQDTSLLATSEKLPESTYHYYFKLFNLTRTSMPVEQIRAIANDPAYRDNHNLLNPLLNNDDTMKPYYGSLIELGISRRKQQKTATHA
ncbi:MAG: B12-binding domain-containing radical SAM protein [Gammaproteobacteria bacterium]|nr:MAG: B12-binding domain-containing radical SAM protein [Gammaproteobacteria bacterium]